MVTGVFVLKSVFCIDYTGVFLYDEFMGYNAAKKLKNICAGSSASGGAVGCER